MMMMMMMKLSDDETRKSLQLAATESPAAAFAAMHNMLGVAQLLQLAALGSQQPLPSTTSIAVATSGRPPSTTENDDEAARSNRGAFRRMLENYGFDEVQQFNENEEFEQRLSMACDQCDRSFSSIWVLKAHYEQVNKTCPSLT
jgi:hypothetical protein